MNNIAINVLLENVRKAFYFATTIIITLQRNLQYKHVFNISTDFILTKLHRFHRNSVYLCSTWSIEGRFWYSGCTLRYVRLIFFKWVNNLNEAVTYQVCVELSMEYRSTSTILNYFNQMKITKYESAKKLD